MQIPAEALVFTGGQLLSGSRNAAIDIPSLPETVLQPSFDFKNKLFVSGLVDVHVHLREPGFFYKESIATGTAAAARGGYTAVCAMPNLAPAPDTPENIKAQLDIIERDALVRVYPYGCITMGRKGTELCDFEALKPYAIAFSDDGSGVQSEDMMREAMRRAAKVGTLICAHCEDESLLCGGYIHDGQYARAHGHKGISSESEWRQVERDLRLARETGCRYHVCHVSTRESVELIRLAKREGVDVTCETAPHYLLLCDEDMREDGRFKMNPPLRSAADRDALIEGLLDGTVDIIATDHAPHSAEEKSRGLANSLMGVVGLETAFAALYTGLCKSRLVPLEKVLRALTDAPRARFGLPPCDIADGADDIAVFDIGTPYTIDPFGFASKGRATPFEGMEVIGRCVSTIVGGEAIWTA